MEEKRKYVRLNLPLKAKYRHPGQREEQKESAVRDISAGGLSIFTAEMLEQRKEICLDICFPDDLGNIYCFGEVVWIKERDKGALIGLGFTHLSSFDRSRIISFINSEKLKEQTGFCENLGQLIFFKETEAIDKPEIMSMLINNAQKLEQGLKFIDKNIDFAEAGTLDILGIDSRDTIVLIELLLEESEYMLITALKHFEWVLRHAAILGKVYRLNINLAKKPRIILISPHFSDSFKHLAETIGPVRMELLEFSCIESRESKGIFLKKTDKLKQYIPAQNSPVPDGSETRRGLTTWPWRR